MPNPTLREIVETFTEEELSLTVPIEFQDVSADDYPYVNEYNRLLASAQTNADTDEGYDAFVAANEYRTVNQEHIDKYVLDAKKLNILMTLVINAYMFAKGEKSATNTSYDNSMSGANADNVQDALDECFQSVSNGKNLIASAITDKKVPTDADATFETMANNINAIKLGSGTAIPSDVKAGKTFTNSDGVEYTGTYDFVSETSASATAAELTKGYTAWVNGTKLTGTLVATSITKNESKSSSYSIGGYGSTTVTLTYSNTVLGVVSYSITDSNNYAKLTSISISGKTITFGMQTYHGHGASGTLTVTAKIAS